MSYTTIFLHIYRYELLLKTPEFERCVISNHFYFTFYYISTFCTTTNRMRVAYFLCILTVPLVHGFILDTFFGKPPTTVPVLDLSKYIGRWFQVILNAFCVLRPKRYACRESRHFSHAHYQIEFISGSGAVPVN